jgi:DNA-binding NarL/FixJ family response regulator
VQAARNGSSVSPPGGIARNGHLAQRNLSLLIVDCHPIFRKGLVGCLSALDDVVAVHEADTAADALEHDALDEVDIIFIDHDAAGGPEAIRRLREHTRASIVVCSSRCDEADVLGSVEAGATGYLRKDTLRPETLAAAVTATANGGGIVAPDLMGTLLHGIARASREILEPRGLTLSRLTAREQQVLALLAEGCSTREVALELSYSERTVKNILHDVVTKFNARTRAQAVAHAVRSGLI